MTTAKKLSTKKNLVLNAIKTLTTILFPLISLPYATRVLGKGGLGTLPMLNQSSVILHCLLRLELLLTAQESLLKSGRMHNRRIS